MRCCIELKMFGLSVQDFSIHNHCLVLNSFSAHIVDSVKRRFSEKNTNIAVIPGELTSHLQPFFNK